MPIVLVLSPRDRRTETAMGWHFRWIMCWTLLYFLVMLLYDFSTAAALWILSLHSSGWRRSTSRISRMSLLFELRLRILGQLES